MIEPNACSSYRLLLGLLVSQPVEGHGRRPRLLIGAQGLAREGLVVLPKTAVRELRDGVVLEPGCSFPLSRALQRPPQEPVHHGPDRTPPVATGKEAQVVRAGAGREWPAEVGVAGESVRFENPETLLQTVYVSGTGYDRCEAGDGAGHKGFAGPHIVVEAKAKFRVPTFVQPPSSAFDPGPDPRPFFFRSADDFGNV